MKTCFLFIVFSCLIGMGCSAGENAGINNCELTYDNTNIYLHCGEHVTTVPLSGTGTPGPKGDIGPVGPVGPKGDTGLQGPKGDTGPAGPIGPKGDTGPQGLQGLIGLQGPIGPQGPSGPQGPQDPQGQQGPVGPPGAQGVAGTKGADGSSAAFDVVANTNDCQYGGYNIYAGVDVNRNGGLDIGERQNSALVCNAAAEPYRYVTGFVRIDNSVDFEHVKNAWELGDVVITDASDLNDLRLTEVRKMRSLHYVPYPYGTGGLTNIATDCLRDIEGDVVIVGAPKLKYVLGMAAASSCGGGTGVITGNVILKDLPAMCWWSARSELGNWKIYGTITLTNVTGPC